MENMGRLVRQGFRGVCLGILGVLLGMVIFTPEAHADKVGYGGVWVVGGGEHPLYERNKTELRRQVRDVLKQKSEEHSLPFELLLETKDIDDMKQEIKDPLTLAVVITREDIVRETFAVGKEKTIVYAGMSLVFYSTERNNGKEVNRVIATAPLTGYLVMKAQSGYGITDREIDENFVKAAVTTLDRYLVKRIVKSMSQQVQGEVKKVQGQYVVLNIGAQHGLRLHDRVKRSSDDRTIGEVISVEQKSSVVQLHENDVPELGAKVYALKCKQLVNTRSQAEETFQVVDVQYSSQAAKKLYGQDGGGSGHMAATIAENLSSYLAEEKGKVVLPSLVGGQWAVGATEYSLAKFVLDGEEQLFEMPKPKYRIHLDITGLSKGIMNQNKVSANYVYKAWMKISIPEKGITKEFDLTETKYVAVNAQQFDEKAIYNNILDQLAAKIAKEVNL
jgi:hypothetical protein